MKFSSTQIEISGLNLERKLNTLNKNGIRLLSVQKISKKKCLVCVPHTNKQQAIDLLSQKCYNEDGTESMLAPPSCDLGLAYFFHWAKRHIAVAVCIALLVPLLWISSVFCWKIDVKSTLPYDTVAACLNQYGIAVGKPLVQLNVSELSNFLCNELHVSYASVGVRGSVLYVELVDRVDFDDGIDLNKPHDIVASQSGIVTRLSVVQGTALVAIGDTVKKGQTLIAGKRTFNDGTTVDVRAIGTVHATVQVSATAQYVEKQTKLVESGNTFVRTVVEIGKISTSRKQISYEYFSVEEQKTSLHPLNITIITQTVYELVEVYEHISFAKAVEGLKNTALQKALQSAFFIPHTTEYLITDGQSVTVTLWGEIQIN